MQEEMWTRTEVPTPGPQRTNAMYCLGYHLPPAEAHRSTKHWHCNKPASASHFPLRLHKGYDGGCNLKSSF